MSRPPRNKMPVSSFGPELLAALRDGSERRVELDFPSRNAAIHFRHRLNTLRAAMRHEGHALAEAVMRAGIRVAPDNECRVVIEPRDSEFSDILKRGGVTVTQTLPRAQTPLPPTEGETPTDSADSFLSTLGIPSEKDVDGSP